MDAKAQTNIIIHESFVPFINRAASVKEVARIISASQQAKWKKKMEPVCAVHKPGVKIPKQNNVKWEPGQQYQYTGPECGDKSGPIQKMIGITQTSESLTCLFFTVVPLSFFL